MGKSKARKTKRVDYKKLNTKGRESTDDEDGDVPSLEDLNLSNKYSKLMTLDKKRGTPQPDRSSGRKESKNNSDPEEQGVKQERFGPSPAVANSMREKQRENMAFQRMIGSDGQARDEFVDFYTDRTPTTRRQDQGTEARSRDEMGTRSRTQAARPARDLRISNFPTNTVN